MCVCVFVPAAGSVRIQPKKMMATIFQFTAFVLPPLLKRPTAAVAPLLQCVVETVLRNSENVSVLAPVHLIQRFLPSSSSSSSSVNSNTL